VVPVRHARVQSAEQAAAAERIREFRRRAETRRKRIARANLSGALVAVDLVVAAMTVISLHGHVREVAGLVFCLVVPGWSIVGLLRLHNAALELGLTMAAGLAALIVIAQLAVSLDLWHLTAIQLVVCALCLPSLLYQSLDRRRVLSEPR
jgi:uncharacterized membrane protein